MVMVPVLFSTTCKERNRAVLVADVDAAGKCIVCAPASIPITTEVKQPGGESGAK